MPGIYPPIPVGEDVELELSDVFCNNRHRSSNNAGSSTSLTCPESGSDSLVSQFNASVASSMDGDIAAFFLEMCHDNVESAAALFKETLQDDVKTYQERTKTTKIQPQSPKIVVKRGVGAPRSPPPPRHRRKNSRQIPKLYKPMDAAEAPTVSAPPRFRSDHSRYHAVTRAQRSSDSRRSLMRMEGRSNSDRQLLRTVDRRSQMAHIHPLQRTSTKSLGSIRVDRRSQMAYIQPLQQRNSAWSNHSSRQSRPIGRSKSDHNRRSQMAYIKAAKPSRSTRSFHKEVEDDCDDYCCKDSPTQFDEYYMHYCQKNGPKPANRRSSSSAVSSSSDTRKRRSSLVANATRRLSIPRNMGRNLSGRVIERFDPSGRAA